MSASAIKVTPMHARRPTPGSRGEEDSVYLTTDSLHDLASPINQICSLCDLVLRNYQGAFDEEAKALFGYMQSSALRLQNLLAGLRTYMQVAGSPPVCRLADGNELLASALRMVEHAISQNEVVVTHDALPALWCDPSQITYVLAGLIDNSIKFRGENRPEIHVSASSDKNTTILSVRDNGMGIDARYVARIFAAFKRVHSETYPGSGVGLAIAKRVMERHGGDIWVESEPGRGSIFFLELPKMEEHATTPEGENAAA